ncbi:MAG: hypothetical protein Q9199_002988 [Rusavskia elegans]
MSTSAAAAASGNSVYIVYYTIDGESVCSENAPIAPVECAFRYRDDAITWCEANLGVPAATNRNQYAFRDGLDILKVDSRETCYVIERRELTKEPPEDQDFNVFETSNRNDVYLCCRVRSGMAGGNTEPPMIWFSALQILYVCTHRGRAVELGFKEQQRPSDSGFAETTNFRYMNCYLW